MLLAVAAVTQERAVEPRLGKSAAPLFPNRHPNACLQHVTLFAMQVNYTQLAAVRALVWRWARPRCRGSPPASWGATASTATEAPQSRPSRSAAP